MSGERIVTSADAFGQFRVKELAERDFSLSSATPTALVSTKCHIVLFYEPYSTDPELINIWQRIAADVAGPVIAGVNTSARTEVMEAFMNVAADLDNPLNPFTSFGPPTIIVYRNRWPQAFYNGQLSYDAIKKWIMVLACKPGYREPYSLYNGVSSVEVDEYVQDPRIQDFAYPTSSRDFTALVGENPREDTVYVDESTVVTNDQVTIEPQEIVDEVVEIQVEEAIETTKVDIEQPAIIVKPPIMKPIRRGCQDVGFNV